MSLGVAGTWPKPLPDGLGKVVPGRQVSEAPNRCRRDVDTVVLEGPTHTFSMDRAPPPQEAIADGSTEGTVTSGMREWLGALPTGDHLRVATFETKVAPWATSQSRPVRRLRSRLALDPRFLQSLRDDLDPRSKQLLIPPPGSFGRERSTCWCHPCR